MSDKNICTALLSPSCRPGLAGFGEVGNGKARIGSVGLGGVWQGSVRHGLAWRGLHNAKNRRDEMSVEPLCAYKDKFLIQSTPAGHCLITDIDSGETLRVNWDTAQHILIDEMFREQKTGGKK